MTNFAALFHITDMNIECDYGGVEDGKSTLKSISYNGAVIASNVGNIGSSITIKFDIGDETFIRSGYVVWNENTPLTAIKFRLRPTKLDNTRLVEAWGRYKNKSS
ncbi:hypothetical protein LIS04_146 [Listeria phage LIS04]|nr:hypothetical protein LIS04_146 [Listeria phage LIS04]